MLQQKSRRLPYATSISIVPFYQTFPKFHPSKHVPRVPKPPLANEKIHRPTVGATLTLTEPKWLKGFAKVKLWRWRKDKAEKTKILALGFLFNGGKVVFFMVGKESSEEEWG